MAGRVARARDGRVVEVDGAVSDASRPALERIGADGPVALLFGSPTCAPCDTVKGLLRELEAEDPSVRWAYVDASDALDLADELAVRRVPTLVALDGQGAVRGRVSGVPGRAELRQMVGLAEAA